jgi:geranylgeranyl pyrophosphate synthase
MIDAKTASLYAASAELGARYSGAPEASVQNAREFGRNLGLAFQIVDDCLDLDGAEDVVGKSLGTDIAEGKITRPMIAMLEGRGESGRARMAAIFEAARETSLNGACNDGARMDRLGVVPVDVESASERARTPLAPSAALKLLASEFDLARALEKSYGVAQSYVQSALDRLYTFPPSPARECLASMAKYVVRRRW